MKRKRVLKTNYQSKRMLAVYVFSTKKHTTSWTFFGTDIWTTKIRNVCFLFRLFFSPLIKTWIYRKIYWRSGSPPNCRSLWSDCRYRKEILANIWILFKIKLKQINWNAFWREHFHLSCPNSFEFVENKLKTK